MSGTVMLCHSDALGNRDQHSGQYLHAMDFEGNDGFGILITTPDVADAMLFDDAIAAFKFWGKVSKNHPIRLMDGKPNKPLTAWTWQFTKVD